jgi:hypothetical protein
MAFQINVFISHSWSYSGHYEKLAEWIFQSTWTSGQNPIRFVDTSVPRTDPIHNAPNEHKLQERIYDRIGASHIVVCPTGMYSSHSKWIGKEIDGAKLLKRPLLAVNPWAQERKSLVVAENADLQVGWNGDSVVKGIWQLTHGIVV